MKQRFSLISNFLLCDYWIGWLTGKLKKFWLLDDSLYACWPMFTCEHNWIYDTKNVKYKIIVSKILMQNKCLLFIDLILSYLSCPGLHLGMHFPQYSHKCNHFLFSSNWSNDRSIWHYGIEQKCTYQIRV